MKEEYLHLLWKLKRIPTTHLKLTDGRALEIINFGWYNTASGPDFFNAKVKIDQLVWSGNVEMHIKSSDWYAHKHQIDQAYENVVLHVVYEHNQDVIVNHEKLPTLELKGLIDHAHFKKFKELSLSKTLIACEKQIMNVPKITWTQQLELTLINRLERKSLELEASFSGLKGDYLQLLYELYAKAFGLKINEIPFIELCKKLPYKLIQNKSKGEITILMLGVSGFLSSNYTANSTFNKEWDYLKNKYSLSEVNSYSWKKKGLRPKSFPERKVKEFAAFCSNADFFNLESIDLNEQPVKSQNLLTDNFTNLLTLNVHCVYLWWKGKRLNDLTLQEKAVYLLEKTDAEKNSIISMWNRFGIFAKSGFETQALIELKNEHCSFKKCLSCKVGITLLTN